MTFRFVWLLSLLRYVRRTTSNAEPTSRISDVRLCQLGIAYSVSEGREKACVSDPVLIKTWSAACSS